jgi:hypothetical protein
MTHHPEDTSHRYYPAGVDEPSNAVERAVVKGAIDVGDGQWRAAT